MLYRGGSDILMGVGARFRGVLSFSIVVYISGCKKHGKSKRYVSNGPKAAYLSKNPVLEPTKIARNRRFPLKIVKFAR